MTGEAPPGGIYPRPESNSLGYWAGDHWDARPVASVGARVLCYLGDLVVVGVLGIAVAALVMIPVSGLAEVSSAESGTPIEDYPIEVWGLAAFVMVFVLYFLCSYRWWGRTPVMMLGRLDVISLDTGTKLGWGDSLARSLVLALGNVCGVLAIVWLVMTAANARKQGPHDSAARSAVLRRP